MKSIGEVGISTKRGVITLGRPGRPRKYPASRRISIILPLKEAEEIERSKGGMSWGDLILELWKFWEAHRGLVKEVCKVGDKEVYNSVDVSVEQGSDKVVVEIHTREKIVRIVALRGYVEEVRRYEFGQSQPQTMQVVLNSSNNPSALVSNSTSDYDVIASNINYDADSLTRSVEDKASDEEEKKEKKKKTRKKRKGEKRAETLKERVRILRIFNNTLIKYPSGYKVKVEGRPGNPSPVPTNLAISWVRDIIRKLELDTDDDIEVFEEEIEANLDKFDPVMKDLLKELLESWREYKARKS